jgi:7,8-dihydro-6-hydroxymethylpterin dimethyltransferase
LSELVPRTSPGDEACFAATRALCNVCGALVEAKVVFQGERVLLAKHCPIHGRTEALLSADRSYYLRSLAYLKPMGEPRARAVATHSACPESCGLCPEHQQHTCVPLLEITDRCDLACPACLIPVERGRGDLTLDDVRRRVDALLRYEDRVNMLTLSGGEPSLHPELLAIVDDLLARPQIGILSLSTNGLSLERRPELLAALVERGVVISLQLDGFDPAVTRRLRGRDDLPALKRRLLDRLLAMNARVSLTVTLERGVNEGELGGILELLFSNESVVSVMVQPLAHAGRAAVELPGDPRQVLTMPEVIGLLARSSGGVLEERDFCPLPCSHPSCFALTYLMRTAAGGLVPLPRLLEAESYLDIIKNQALLNTDADSLLRVRDSLYALWSSDGIIPDREPVLKTVRQILLDLGQLGGSPPHRDVLQLGARHIKSIFIHAFMDRYTFDLARVIKCCNHYPQADGRLIPACVRNNIPQKP